MLNKIYIKIMLLLVGAALVTGCEKSGRSLIPAEIPSGFGYTPSTTRFTGKGWKPCRKILLCWTWPSQGMLWITTAMWTGLSFWTLQGRKRKI